MTGKTKRKRASYIILGFVLIVGLIIFSVMVRNKKITHNSRASYSSPTPTSTKCAQNNSIVLEVFPNASDDAYANLKINNNYDVTLSKHYTNIEQENINNEEKNLTFKQGNLYMNTFWWFESKRSNTLQQGKQQFILPIILNLELPNQELPISKDSAYSIYVDCGNGTSMSDEDDIKNKDDLLAKIWNSDDNIPVCSYEWPGVYSMNAVFTLHLSQSPKSSCIEAYSLPFTFEIK